MERRERLKYQCHNPYLPIEEHIPDGEPRVFEDRLYVFGSHDLENGKEFCEQDYVTWSASVDDLSDWRYEGVIYRKDQDPYNQDVLPLYAPDVICGPDRRYYLYYCIKFQDSIHVAVADRPTGPYEFYGRVHYPDGQVMSENQPYDPSVIVTDGKVYLYFGFAPCMINIPRYKGQDLRGGSVLELENDMLTVKKGPEIVIPSMKYGKGTSFEGNEYFEGPSIRKIGDLFYLIYSSVNTHQLCYATSSEPMSGFVFRGCIISNGDVGYKGRKEEDKVMSVGNDHGGLVKIKDQWYVFYHRHTSLNQYNRQGCAEKIQILEDGSIPQVCVTTSGMNPEPLSGKETYPAVYCCNLTNGHMGALNSLGRSNREIEFPYITSVQNERYITNISDGDRIGYKYINLSETNGIEVTYRCSEDGVLEIYSDLDCSPESQKGKIYLRSSKDWKDAETTVTFQSDEKELYFRFRGKGKADLNTLKLS